MGPSARHEQTSGTGPTHGPVLSSAGLDTAPLSHSPASELDSPEALATASPSPGGARGGGSLRRRTLRGLACQLIGVGAERGIRFGIQIVAAWLLTPDSFGLFAMVIMTLAAVDTVSFLATDQAIVASPRGRDPTFLNTVFWVAAVRGTLVGGLVVALSPLAGIYFARPEVTPMVMAFAATPALMGLSSPRLRTVVKDLRFGAWAIYRLVCVSLGAAVTIALALWLRSVWALVLGHVGIQALLTVGSYFVAPFRPRMSFERSVWRELLTYGKKAAGTPALIALAAQAPALILGRLDGAAALGAFMLNLSLARLPVELSLQVIGNVAMPAYAMLSAQRERLATAWLEAFRAVSSMTAPLSVALVFMGDHLPRMVYGAEYAGTPGLFSWIAAAGGFWAMTACIGPLFWGVGRPDRDRAVQAARVVILFAGGLALAPAWGARGMAMALVGAMAGSLLVALFGVRRELGLSWARVLRPLAPSALAAGATAVGCAAALAWLDVGPMRLISTAAIGGAGAAGALAWQYRGALGSWKGARR